MSYYDGDNYRREMLWEMRIEVGLLIIIVLQGWGIL